MRNIVLGFVLVALAVFGFQAQTTPSPVNSLGGVKEFTETPTKAVKNKPPVPLTRVIRVIDGDTIVIGENGRQEKVRLIGVNTPESVDPRKKVECFGKEASRFTTLLLLNKEVRLERDPSQSDRDKYDRLLRFVFLLDGTLANRTIITQGYGHEYTYRTPHLYQHDFKAEEDKAKSQKRGLWAPDACTQTP